MIIKNVLGTMIIAILSFMSIYIEAQTTDELIEKLYSPNVRTRRYAIKKAAKNIKTAKKIMSHIIKALADSDRYVYMKAMQTIIRIDADWHKSQQIHDEIPTFVNALSKDGPLSRSELYWRSFIMDEVLSKIGPPAKQAVPVLVKILSASNLGLHGSAIRTLGNIGPDAKIAIPLMIKTFDEERLAYLSMEALQKIGSAAVPALTEALYNRKNYASSFAARTLGKIGPNAQQAVPNLIEVLTFNDDAKDALDKICSYNWRQSQIAKEVVRESMAKLKSANLDDKEEALNVITILGAPKESIAEIAKLLSSSNSNLCIKSANALSKLKSKEAVPQLIIALNNPNRYVVDAVIEALMNIGNEAKLAIPHLVKMISKNKAIEKEVRAITKIGYDNKYIPILSKRLPQVTSSSQTAILYSLGQKKSEASQALAQIIVCRGSINSYVSNAAEMALQKINPHWAKDSLAENAVLPLIQILRNEESYPYEAIKTLGKLGIVAEKSVPDLIKLLERKSTCEYTIIALGEIKSEKAIPILIKTLKEKGYYLGREILKSLEKIGPKAIEALKTIPPQEDYVQRMIDAVIDKY